MTPQWVVIGIILCMAGTTQAQISLNINVGTPPPWGPVGYTEVRYYYLPDVHAYYDVQSSMFIYYGGGRWIHRTYLPSRYRNYDLYNGYKVVMSDYHGDAPYIHYKEHKVKYRKGYHGEHQRTIGERPGNGNRGPGISHENNQHRKGIGRGDRKNSGPGNNNPTQKDNSRKNGKGKKK